MLELALNTPTVHTVILSTILKFNSDNAEGKVLIEQFRDTIRRYVEAGKHVIYVFDVPVLDFEPRPASNARYRQLTNQQRVRDAACQIR